MYIVYPASVNYTFLYQRPQQLMRCFGWSGYKGIYLNGPALIEGSTEVFKPTKVSENLTVVPPTHQLYEYRGDSLLYCTYPPYLKVKKQIDPYLTIFDSIDEPVGVFAHWNHDNVYEKALMDSDIVVASAQKLYDIALEYRDEVVLAPNGCDYYHFSQPQAKPEVFRRMNINKPVITFTGALATWLDNELIYETARRFPQYEVLLVGPVYDGRYENSPSNVHFTGHQPYQDMPGYLHNSDVLIIPFDVTNPVIEATNPIKLWEYLATGKPIVTTNIPEITMTDCVYKAQDWEDFFEGIEKSIEEGISKKQQAKCRALAEENSWMERATRILKAAEALL